MIKLKIKGQELNNPFAGHGVAICYILIWAIFFGGIYVACNGFQTYDVSVESYYATMHNSTTIATTYSSDARVTIQTPLYLVYGIAIMWWLLLVPLLLWIWLILYASNNLGC